MKTFSCVCGNKLFFENFECVACKRELGFLPDRQALAALRPKGADTYEVVAGNGEGSLYRKCHHYKANAACNWMIPESEQDIYCLSCRLTQTIPDLGKPNNRKLWIRIERRKRRLVFDLCRHSLPVISKTTDPEAGLAFAFLEDRTDDAEFSDSEEGKKILTGHANGLITINIAEADTVKREEMRQLMNEQQRTLLGHLRHESGHYYWDRLVADSPFLDTVRDHFGDERENYGNALESYYANGPDANWTDNFVSAYASSHPWEDWAECWAHYLQINDALETAVEIGMLQSAVLDGGLESRISHWVELAGSINLISRTLDQPDPYPFVLMPPVIDKLKLIDKIVVSVDAKQ